MPRSLRIQFPGAFYHVMARGNRRGYIHLNPVRARLIRPKSGQSVMDNPWSSVAGGWMLPPSRRPKWLAAAQGLKRFDLPDTASDRRRLVEHLDRRAVSEEMKKCGVPALPEGIDARCSHLRRGWYWGGQEFAEKLRRLSEQVIGGRTHQSRAYRKPHEVRAHSEEQAERWLAQGLRAAGVDPAGLENLRGSDPRKLALADLLWKRTTVSQEWIATRLAMGSAANVSQQLRRLDHQKLAARLPPSLKEFLNTARESQ